MRVYLLFCFVLVFCASCDKILPPNFFSINEEKKTPKKKKKEGLVINYRANGKVLSEVNFKNEKLEGPSKSYYNDGTIHQEISYKEGIKHGIANTYYENGHLARSTPYKEGKIDGIQKRYRQDGSLLAEIPYKDDQPGKGLKEYLKNGKVKSQYPTIVIQPVDNMLKMSSYHLKLSLSQKLSKKKFYGGNLDNGYLHYDLVTIPPRSKNGEFELDFFVPPGAFLMQKINIICHATTISGNPFIIEKEYNLAVENKGF